MEALLECCCGIDVHRDTLQVCILKGLTDTPEVIRAEFKTMQQDLQELVQWLIHHDCNHIAMESTGVYWRPVYEAIEECHSNYQSLLVVNAHHMRNLPGRKSDIKDSEWIATLLRHGLLTPSFIPDKITRTLREYSRLYRSFIGEKSRYLNRLEKFLQTHGFKLSSVMSNIYGVSGKRLLYKLSEKGYLISADIIEAVDRRVKASNEEIHAAIKGKLAILERRLLKTLLTKVDQVQSEIDEILAIMREVAEPYQSAVEQLDSIPGVDTVAAYTIIAEISATPHNYFSTSAKLCSWAGLSPRNDESAGKVKSRKILHGNPYIKSILCQVAWAAVRVRNSSFALWFWSHQGKLGKKKAIIAVARKILTLIYKLLQSGEFYDSIIALKAYSSPPLHNS
ncbi:IS110 family transposase [Sporomusa sp.]|uniref:IS110 family transposase n=1 Tax=Sporomusa sp. TaxID=2078658 RepID=UPI002CA4CE47|nr:IS110 family transposase [Sporomusa sp.]HWR43902.1 IS110 family transposase [Sporomusa sp.]